MKKIAKNQFIGEYEIPHYICDGLIELHKATPMISQQTLKKHPGYPIFKIPGQLGDKLHIPEWKDSIDVYINAGVIRDPKMAGPKFYEQVKMINIYWIELCMLMHKYAQDLCYEDAAIGHMKDEIFSKINMTEGINIQYYEPGAGYYRWHTERSGSQFMREFVYMTYLNDVPKGGTEFYYQEKTFEAKKGKTLIWPAHYTHIHRGQITQEHEKYIATGWISYPNKWEPIATV